MLRPGRGSVYECFLRPLHVALRKIVSSVFVLVSLSLVRCVGVIVRTVVFCVIVAVRTLLYVVFVRVFVFVPVCVYVGVRVFVAVNRVPVDVIVAVIMGVLVGMQMLVLVVAFHI